jgi:hypothetical protein
MNEKVDPGKSFNFLLKSLKLSNCFILVGILLYNQIFMFTALLLKTDVIHLGSHYSVFTVIFSFLGIVTTKELWLNSQQV